MCKKGLRPSAMGILLLALLFLFVNSAHADQYYDFPITRGNSEYEYNLKLVLTHLGKGGNQWIIPANGEQSFNETAGAFNSKNGFNDIWIQADNGGNGEWVPGAGACDVATWFYMSARDSGILTPLPDRLDHPTIPGTVGKGVTIWNPVSDLKIQNPNNYAIEFRWDLTARPGYVRIWVERAGGFSGFSTPAKTVVSLGIVLVGLVILVGIFWLISSIKINDDTIKKSLEMIQKATDMISRWKARQRLARIERKHGLTPITVSGFVCLVLTIVGFYLANKGTQDLPCTFALPVSTDRALVSAVQSELTGGKSLEIQGSKGETINATSNGKIVWAGQWPIDTSYHMSGNGFGNTVIVDSTCAGKHWYTFYGHLDQITVRSGQSVSQGSQLGTMGNTGQAQNVSLFYGISAVGPAYDHQSSDWEDPLIFTAAHTVVNPVDQLEALATKWFGIALIVFALLGVIWFSQLPGILGYIKDISIWGVLLALLLVVSQFNFQAIKINWNGLFNRTKSSVYASSISLPANTSNVLYAGVYGSINGWGTLGLTNTADGAIAKAEDYASQVRTWYTGTVVPVVNVRVDSDQTMIQQIISGCNNRCIVMLDMTPNQDVSGIISEYAPLGDNVWIDVDLEHKGSPTDTATFNSWASTYFAIRTNHGFNSLGVFAFYDFRSNPWLTPTSQIVWSYNGGKGIVVPIFDGHCSGTPCETAKFTATRATLSNYSHAPSVGIMEFLNRWGCGSQYGDCGFSVQDYWQEFKPLLLMSQ